MSGVGVDKVRSALAALKAGTGDYPAVQSAVGAAQFEVRPEAHSLDDLAEQWDYTPIPDSFPDTVGAARWQNTLSGEQVKELKGMAKFAGPATTAPVTAP